MRRKNNDKRCITTKSFTTNRMNSRSHRFIYRAHRREDSDDALLVFLRLQSISSISFLELNRWEKSPEKSSLTSLDPPDVVELFCSGIRLISSMLSRENGEDRTFDRCKNLRPGKRRHSCRDSSRHLFPFPLLRK